MEATLIVPDFVKAVHERQDVSFSRECVVP